MKLSSITSIISTVGAVSAITVSYDEGYDQADRSLTAVACSDGENGLISRYGWQTQGQAPDFPLVGGAQAVGGWNSPACGSCWRLEYKGHRVNVLAIDHAVEGFNIAKTALDALTGGLAEQLGRVEAEAVEVDVAECGIKP